VPVIVYGLVVVAAGAIVAVRVSVVPAVRTVGLAVSVVTVAAAAAFAAGCAAKQARRKIAIGKKALRLYAMFLGTSSRKGVHRLAEMKCLASLLQEDDLRFSTDLKQLGKEIQNAMRLDPIV
jgi:hypothetical protein